MMVVHNGHIHCTIRDVGAAKALVEEEKARPAVSLREVLMMVLSILPVDCRNNYRGLATALRNHTGTVHQAELHRIKPEN